MKGILSMRFNMVLLFFMVMKVQLRTYAIVVPTYNITLESVFDVHHSIHHLHQPRTLLQFRMLLHQLEILLLRTHQLRTLRSQNHHFQFLVEDN